MSSIILYVGWESGKKCGPAETVALLESSVIQ